MLLGYVFFVLSVTILSRRPFRGNHFQPRLFWSWGVPRLREEIIMNIIGFTPVGFLAGKWGWKTIILAAGLSLTVEIIQLLTHTGLFEFDDVIHNTAGAVIGFILYTIIHRILGARHEENMEESD